MQNKKFLKYIAEMTGTFCLLFFGTGAIVVSQLFPGDVGHLEISLVFGLIIMAMIYAVGHISGAHFNPAVSIGFYSAGRLKKSEVSFYVLSQVIGASLASLLLRGLFSTEPVSYGMTLPLDDLWVMAAVIEFVLTAGLMFVIMAVATDHRAQGVMAGVAIGGYVLLAALFAGPLSGASMNPARSFGPALIEGDFYFHWLYWIAPILGSIFGAWLYGRVQCAAPSSSDGHGCC